MHLAISPNALIRRDPATQENRGRCCNGVLAGSKHRHMHACCLATSAARRARANVLEANQAVWQMHSMAHQTARHTTCDHTSHTHTPPQQPPSWLSMTEHLWSNASTRPRASLASVCPHFGAETSQVGRSFAAAGLQPETSGPAHRREWQPADGSVCHARTQLLTLHNTHTPCLHTPTARARAHWGAQPRCCLATHPLSSHHQCLLVRQQRSFRALSVHIAPAAAAGSHGGGAARCAALLSRTRTNRLLAAALVGRGGVLLGKEHVDELLVRQRLRRRQPLVRRCAP